MFIGGKECEKRGQVTLFIILGVVIVVGVSLLLIFKGDVLSPSSVPSEFSSLYDTYLSCIKATTKDGIMLLGDKGGLIETSTSLLSSYTEYSPYFSFLGNDIPYWLYLSMNGSYIDQVPTKRNMEKQLEEYISDRLSNCDFAELKNEGYYMNIEDGDVYVTINDESVSVEVINNVDLYYDGDYYSVELHDISVESKLGKFYNIATSIYDYEKTGMFLENYTMDVLWNYAPVEDFSFDCSSQSYSDSEIKSDLKEALDANINAIKINGNYYDDSYDSYNDYFVADVGISSDENVNFMYNKNWKTSIDIYGDKKINPIDSFSGMLGICFSSLHLVYDIRYPVLVQIWDDDFVFQFPIRVVIDNTNPRQSLSDDNLFETTTGDSVVCNNMGSNVEIRTYDGGTFAPIKTDLVYSCASSTCEIGSTGFSNGNYIYSGKIPTCVNGLLTVSADGYESQSIRFSSVDESELDVLLYEEHDINVTVKDISVKDNVLISFHGNISGATKTISYPNETSVALSEDEYTITAYVMSGNSLTIPESKEKYCTQQVTALTEIFGITKDVCSEITTPAIEMESVIIGGGNTVQYFTNDMLNEISVLSLTPTILGVPKTSEDLQNNYLNVQDSYLDVEFE